MSTNRIDIRSKILTMLQTLTQLHDVYDEEVGKPLNGKYPFATITYASGTGSFGDTKRNLRTTQFHINVYVDRTQAGFGNSNAETIFLTILDAIDTLFDNNTTLDGMVKYVKVLSDDADYTNREIGDVRVGTITVEAMTVVDSIT